jgi:hypothetical protein
MALFMSVKMQECLLDQELAIGQYGSKILGSVLLNTIPTDKNKRNGSPGGWIADWVSERYQWFIPGEDSLTVPSNWPEGENANREFIDISFPCEMEVEQVRIQGLKKTKIAKEHDNSYSWGWFQSYATEFELWCTDGNEWWSMHKDTPTVWRKVDTILDHTNQQYQNDLYADIRKFGTGLTNEWDIAEIDVPEHLAGWLGCRIHFTKYLGSVLGAKVGLNVYDPNHKVCNRQCKCKDRCNSNTLPHPAY